MSVMLRYVPVCCCRNGKSMQLLFGSTQGLGHLCQQRNAPLTQQFLQTLNTRLASLRQQHGSFADVFFCFFSYMGWICQYKTVVMIDC